MRAAFVSIVVAGAFLGAARGCSSSSSGVASEGESGTDAGVPFDVYVTDAPHCVIPPKPAQIPDGWELYTGYDPCCMMYVPSSPQYLPPPLRWTTCNAGWSNDGGTDGGECRQLDQPAAIAPEFGASVRDGIVTLLTNELINGSYASVIADADGPVHQAFLQDSAGLCGPSPSDMRDGKYVYQIYNTSGFTGGGFLAGDVSEFRPSFVHHFNDGLTHGVVVGKPGVLDVDESDTFHLYEWNDTPKTLANPQDIGLQNSFPFFSTDALFWSASGNGTNRVVAYTGDGGAADLLSSGSDTTTGYDDFGTDGTDMVWMLGEGHDAGAIGFDTTTLFTAPFALVPGNVVPRRLRSESGKRFGVAPTRVGCGYAARSNGDYLRVVRLADGVSWKLASSAAWSWMNPLAITCDEVFAAVVTGPNKNNVARINIASLGPGIPPD